MVSYAILILRYEIYIVYVSEGRGGVMILWKSRCWTRIRSWFKGGSSGRFRGIVGHAESSHS